MVLRLKLAMPPDRPTVRVGGAPAPAKTNWTLPVGVPAPGATTPMVAEKVTAWPKTPAPGVTAGLDVVVPAWLTANPCGPETALAAKLASPRYRAVTV